MNTLRAAILLCMVFVASTATLAAKAPSLSKSTYLAVQSAQEKIDAGKAGLAAATLRKLIAKLNDSPFEQAVALQVLAQAEMTRDDPVAALRALEQCLTLKVISDGAHLDLLNNLAQVAMAAKHYERSIVHISAWIAGTPKPRAEAYALLGSARLQLAQHRKAITPLKKAIALSKRPQESWYQALLGAYYETQDYRRCVELLYRMVRLYPQRDAYWRQLVGIELTRERHREALAVMELAYLRDAVTSNQDLLALAQLRAQQNEPYKAAELLEAEIAAGRVRATTANWEFIANAWYQARETGRSVAALRRAVTAKGAKPSLQMRLAQLYVEAAKWQQAIDILQPLIRREVLGSDDRGRSWLLLGIAHHGSKSTDHARSAFVEAAKVEAVRRDAAQWLAYLDATG